MYLDDEAPISGGREIWAFPKKYANPKLELVSDTLTGTLHYAGHYAGQLAAMGTMAYKHKVFAREPRKTVAALSKQQVNLSPP